MCAFYHRYCALYISQYQPLLFYLQQQYAHHLAGFLVQEESIDRQEHTDTSKKSIPGQTINIYTKSWSNPNFIPDKGATSINSIDNESIYKVLQPYIPQITQIVKDNRNLDEFNKLYPNQPNKEPMLQWIFFRKYSPTAQRNSLKHHVDTNINTVNIELSNDYVGGGLFIIKQFSSNNSIAEDYYEEKSGYEWINTIKRVNTSDIVFPELHAGDAIFYDYTVRHGVAPIESGIRYSVAFFYDWVKESLDVDIRSYLHDIELDFVLVYDAELDMDDKFSMLFEKITTEIITYEACEGDIIHVYKSGTEELVSKIEIKRDQHYYKISDELDSDPNEFGIKLHNQLDIDLDIVLSYDAAQQRTVQRDLYLDVTPQEEIIYHAYNGDVLQVFIAETDEEVAKLVINRDQYLYPIQQRQMEDTAVDSEEL